MSKTPGTFWDLQGYQEKKWFATVSIGLISLIILYIILHVFICKNSYEYGKLDDKQIQQINRIYFGDTVKVKKEDTIKLKQVTNSSDTPKTKIDTPNISKPDIAKPKSKDLKCDSINTCMRVLQYLNSEFQLDSCQIKSFKEYLCYSSPLEATSFLSNLKLRVKSYFWLKGPSSYFEIIFWTLFGVLCNILFGLGIVSKKSTNNPLDLTTFFDSSEIPSQVAKMFYAPLCTLIIVFGYNYFTSQSLADISSSKGVIVFAFVGGFYSERLIAFLDRLKDVLLPNSGKADLSETKQTALRNVVIQLNKPQPAAGVPNKYATLDVSTANVLLTYTKTGDTITAKNIDISQPTLFIADFIQSGDYKINATLTDKNAIGTVLALTAEQNFEMKASDMFIAMQLQ